MKRLIIVLLLFINASAWGQASVFPEKLAKILSQSQTKYIEIVEKIDSITKNNNKKNAAIKLYPVIKLIYNNNGTIDTDSEQLDMALAIDFETKRVFRFDIGKNIFVEEARKKIFLSQVAKGNVNLLYNNNEFFSYFFDVDREMADVLSIANQQGTVIFFSKKSAQPFSATELINSSLGSYENYLKYKAAEAQRHKIEKEADKIFTDFSLTDNWHLYQQYRKTDTLNSVSLLLQDIKKEVTNDAKILNKLEHDIYAYLRGNDTLNINFTDELYRDLHYRIKDMVIFMGKDISSVVKSSLGDSLYAKFKYREELGYELQSRLENSLSARFIGDWKKLREFIPNNIKVISTSPFSYVIKNDERTPLERLYKLYKFFF
ncbi:hypothetical protein [Pedobacter sp. UBA4863]|uniref:hypothetical protein n=1 Tax=Pedobacter sp. UBA4863 TaxID=1947060 RepID=UPI0025E5B02F|nr:hypothetical protein [Pedobacter sp. UBA4863]